MIQSCLVPTHALFFQTSHGVWISDHGALQALKTCHPVCKHGLTPQSYREDLARALHVGLSGNHIARRQVISSGCLSCGSRRSKYSCSKDAGWLAAALLGRRCMLAKVFRACKVLGEEMLARACLLAIHVMVVCAAWMKLTELIMARCDQVTNPALLPASCSRLTCPDMPEDLTPERALLQLVSEMYAPDAEFWHPLCHVSGSRNIAGYLQAWATFNHTVDVRIFGFSVPPCVASYSVLSSAGVDMMVDALQYAPATGSKLSVAL